MLMIGLLTLSILLCIYLYSKHRQSLEHIKLMMVEFDKLTTSDDMESMNLIQASSGNGNGKKYSGPVDNAVAAASSAISSSSANVAALAPSMSMSQMRKRTSLAFLKSKSFVNTVQAVMAASHSFGASNDSNGSGGGSANGGTDLSSSAAAPNGTLATSNELSEARAASDEQAECLASQCQLLESQLERARTELRHARARLEVARYQPPARLLHILNRTYESEKELLAYKFKVIEKEKEACLEALNKVSKRQAGILGALKIAHSSTLEEVNHKLEILK